MSALRPDPVALRGVPAVAEKADTLLVVAESELPRYAGRMGQGELLSASILFGSDEVVALGPEEHERGDVAQTQQQKAAKQCGPPPRQIAQNDTVDWTVHAVTMNTLHAAASKTTAVVANGRVETHRASAIHAGNNTIQ